MLDLRKKTIALTANGIVIANEINQIIDDIKKIKLN